MLYSALHPPFQRPGSRANIDIADISEAADGFRVAREWVRHVCHDLSYGPPKMMNRFEQWFTVACTLAFELDRENARGFVPHRPMYRLGQWPRSLFREQGDFVGLDLIAFFTAEAYGSLTSGSLYLQCV